MKSSVLAGSKTPRYQIDASFCPSLVTQQDMDRLFELADTELNSDKAVHDEFQRLRQQHTKMDLLFTRFLVGRLQAICHREGMVLAHYPTKRVAEHLAKLWVAQAEQEQKNALV